MTRFNLQNSFYVDCIGNWIVKGDSRGGIELGHTLLLSFLFSVDFMLIHRMSIFFRNKGGRELCPPTRLTTHTKKEILHFILVIIDSKLETSSRKLQ